MVSNTSQHTPIPCQPTHRTFTQGKGERGGGGELERNYLRSINSNKRLAQSSFTGQHDDILLWCLFC
jgi:hypothetical protein